MRIIAADRDVFFTFTPRVSVCTPGFVLDDDIDEDEDDDESELDDDDDEESDEDDEDEEEDEDEPETWQVSWTGRFR